MAYDPLVLTNLQAGKPLTEDITAKIKSNEDDLNSRLNDVEAGANKVEVWNATIYNADSASSITGLDYYEGQTTFTLTTCRIQIFTVGSLTGDLEIDVQKSTTIDGSYSSIFSTKPKINLSTASDGDSSDTGGQTSAVFSVTSMASTEFLRLDLSSLPTGVIGRFRIILIGETS